MKFEVGDLVIGNRLASDRYGLTVEGVIGRVADTRLDGLGQILLLAVQDEDTTVNIAKSKARSHVGDWDKTLRRWYEQYKTEGFWVGEQYFDIYESYPRVSLSEYMISEA